MADATKGRKPLSPAALRLCLPVLAGVLRWPQHSPLHDPALAVLGLHVSPELDVPRADMLELLYHVLDTIPAFRCDSSLHSACRPNLVAGPVGYACNRAVLQPAAVSGMNSQARSWPVCKNVAVWMSALIFEYGRNVATSLPCATMQCTFLRWSLPVQGQGADHAGQPVQWSSGRS